MSDRGADRVRLNLLCRTLLVHQAPVTRASRLPVSGCRSHMPVSRLSRDLSPAVLPVSSATIRRSPSTSLIRAVSVEYPMFRPGVPFEPFLFGSGMQKPAEAGLLKVGKPSARARGAGSGGWACLKVDGDRVPPILRFVALSAVCRLTITTAGCAGPSPTCC